MIELQYQSKFDGFLVDLRIGPAEEVNKAIFGGEPVFTYKKGATVSADTMPAENLGVWCGWRTLMVRQMLFLHFFMSLFMRLHCDSRKAVCSGANLSQRMYRPVSRRLTNLWQIRSVNWGRHFLVC